ncbi:MAG: DinB family protein [Anaerolineae bacterium]|nr:DinB family protein [Anaerolineae bacterium]
MSEGRHLAETLIAFFAYADHGVLTPFTAAIAGLTAEQAARVPGPGFHSVWAVVNHVRFWHEVTLLQLRGLPDCYHTCSVISARRMLKLWKH